MKLFSIRTLNEKYNIISMRAFNEIYIGIMVLFCLAVFFSNFLNGFWSDLGLPLAFFVIFIAPIIFLITIIYFVICIIIRLRTKKWPQNKWANILPILAILFILFIPFIFRIGKYSAYHYAGFNNLKRDADKLMATAPSEGMHHPLGTELKHSNYPLSFKKVGACRVFIFPSSVAIIRGGWVSGKYGIIIYANGNKNGIDSNYHQVSNRIFELEWN